MPEKHVLTGFCIANSQCLFLNRTYSQNVLHEVRSSESEKYKAGGFKQLGRILVRSIKMDGNVSRRVSLTNWPGVPATTASP